MYLFVEVFLSEGREVQKTTKTGHHRHASEMPYKWRFAITDDGPTLSAGLVAV